MYLCKQQLKCSFPSSVVPSETVTTPRSSARCAKWKRSVRVTPRFAPHLEALELKARYGRLTGAGLPSRRGRCYPRGPCTGMTTRVLVVDDSPTIRKVVSAVLERHGFESTQAADGQEALEALGRSSAPGAADGASARPIDLVLVDFVMPRMNGFQLCRAMRQKEELRGIPVVLMSAKSDQIREHFVQQTGAIGSAPSRSPSTPGRSSPSSKTRVVVPRIGARIEWPSPFRRRRIPPIRSVRRGRTAEQAASHSSATSRSFPSARSCSPFGFRAQDAASSS